MCLIAYPGRPGFGTVAPPSVAVLLCLDAYAVRSSALAFAVEGRLEAFCLEGVHTSIAWCVRPLSEGQVLGDSVPKGPT